MNSHKNNSRRRRSRSMSWLSIAQALESRALLTGIVHTLNFEDVGASLAATSAFNGPVSGGVQQEGTFGDQIVVGDFSVQEAAFSNVYSLDFGSWSGWAYSNRTDNTTPGFSNDLSSFSGAGAGGSATYGVSFVDAFSPSGLPSITLTESDSREFESLKINNSTYAGLSMALGDSFAKKFGGVSGNDPDWFLLTITGKDASEATIGTIDFYLADYRFADNSLDYVVDEWTEVFIPTLSAARSLEFSLSSSDNGAFGMNTPAYFAIDDIQLVEPAADLVPAAFNAATDHVLSGQTDVTFTIQNVGTAAASAFSTHVVWSPNGVLGDSDDVVIAGTTQTFSGLEIGETVSRTVGVQLNRSDLLSHALLADTADQAVGTISQDVSHLYVLVDVNNDVTEVDEDNNASLQNGTTSDDITYFPWDKNSNGVVEPLEALHSVQVVGQSDAESDLNGDGIVSPFEALSVVQRIGYVRNSAAAAAAAGKASKKSLSLSAVAETSSKAVVSDQSTATVPVFLPLPLTLDDDEEELHQLFETFASGNTLDNVAAGSLRNSPVVTSGAGFGRIREPRAENRILVNPATSNREVLSALTRSEIPPEPPQKSPVAAWLNVIGIR